MTLETKSRSGTTIDNRNPFDGEALFYEMPVYWVTEVEAKKDRARKK
jgi:hypothetical protein